MVPTELHCAGCRLSIFQFLTEVYYPACHHIFCPACMRQGVQSQGCFTCPLDYVSVAICADDSERFYTCLSQWISAESDGKDTEKAWNALKPCVNFTLFPCRMPKNHPGYEVCPYDHSLKSQAPETTWVWIHFCTKCRVRVSSETCPRCHSPTTWKQGPHSRSCRSLVLDYTPMSPSKKSRGW